MAMIKPYKKCQKCGALIVSGKLCEDCKPMTNADRIRQMTDEELAEFIAQRGTCDTCCIELTRCITTANCKGGVLAWLRKEADEDAG